LKDNTLAAGLFFIPAPGFGVFGIISFVRISHLWQQQGKTGFPCLLHFAI